MTHANKSCFSGRRDRRQNQGFTLLEILITVAVVGLALVALIRLQMMSLRMVDRDAMRTQASLLADEVLAQTLAERKYDSGHQTGQVQIKGHTYHWRTDIAPAAQTELDPLSLQGLRELRVEVRWGRDNEQAATLSTLVYAGRAR